MNVHDDKRGATPLADLPRELPPPPGLEEQVLARLAGRRLLSRRSAKRWLVPLAAALAGLAAGWLLRGAPAPVSSRSEAALYLLLLSGEPQTAHSEPELVSIYKAWGSDLAARGQLAGSQKLKHEGIVLADGSDGPASTLEIGRETPSGFFLVRAPSLAEAETLARSCPHARFGGRVTVRPIDPV